MGSAGLHTTADRQGGRRRVLDGLIELVRHRGGTGALTHGIIVGRMASKIAREMGLATARSQGLALAGVLHDIGKTRISREILDKPSELTPSEWRQMHRHPLWGASILARNGLDELAPWVAAHHERPDGLGYPLGLTGQVIPQEARIIAVVDAYEAMTGERPYRSPLGSQLALARIACAAGSQLDAEVVAAFLASGAYREVSARV